MPGNHVGPLDVIATVLLVIAVIVAVAAVFLFATGNLAEVLGRIHLP